MNTTLPPPVKNRDRPAQENMYRRIFASPAENLTIAIPQNWRGQMIEVIAFPVNEPFNAPAPVATANTDIMENRRKREKNSRKYAVSFKTLGYVFNRAEANNYEVVKSNL